MEVNTLKAFFLGWGQVGWRLPVAPVPDGVVIEEHGTSSTLELHNATWRQTGRYVCEEPSSHQTKSLDIFIPGHGSGVVMKEGLEGRIPCVVSDPSLNVSLYERDGREPVQSVQYRASQGFSGPLNDSSYRCVAQGGGREKTSQTFYVFSIIGVYACFIKDTVHSAESHRESVNITVLERGFVRAEARGGPDVSCPLEGDLELQVDVEAFPSPTITWRHGNNPIPMETSLVSTTKTSITRYMSRLMLVGVQRNHSGPYSATVVNDYEVREVTFDVEVTEYISWRRRLLSAVRLFCVSLKEDPPLPFTGTAVNHNTGFNGVVIQTNVSHPGDQHVTQVHSLLVLPNLHSVSAVRCEVQNRLGRRAWDLRLVTSSVVVVLVALTLIFLIMLIIVWRKKPHYECMWRLMDSSDGLYSSTDPSLLPSTAAWELQRDSITLGSPLGSGGFGQIVEASVTGWSHKAAVKMLRRGSGQSSLMLEAQVLSALGSHLNIANLLGVCSPPGDSSVLSLQDLISFSHQVAQGMAFLSSNNCVNRDVAARNVGVCGGGLVKVGDWRLSHDLHKDNSYVARGNCYLPVKWMSPESIFQCVYTTQSDVWSYGVLLWEIFSLGEAPYSELTSTHKLCSALKTGYRMNRPQHASPALYQLMIGCWKTEPASRPSFTSLTAATSDMLDQAHKQRYSQLKQNFLSVENAATTRSRAARTDKQPGNLDAELPEAGSSHSYMVTMETSAQVLAGPESLQTL
ncbi:unnamed protein product [Merluccius merluccius]